LIAKYKAKYRQHYNEQIKSRKDSIFKARASEREVKR
jgi:hypothetical protein